MKIKLYDNTDQEINAGLPYDVYFSGRPDVKAWESNNEWVENTSFDLAKVIEQKNKEIEAKRQARYQKESDPIFMQFQRGTKTKQDWLDAIDKIKSELPYETI